MGVKNVVDISHEQKMVFAKKQVVYIIINMIMQRLITTELKQKFV